MLNAYKNADVVLIRKTGTMTWGEKSTGRKTVRARVEDESKLIRNTAGENVLVKAVVYLTDIDLQVGDRIEIEDVEYPILYLKRHKSFARTLVLEVGIG
jgi:hypothetical protein